MFATDFILAKNFLRRASAPAKTRNIEYTEIVDVASKGSLAVSDKFEVAFCAQCRNCHHWHDGVKQTIYLQRTLPTHVNCRKCNYRMMVLNGLSRNMSLASRETTVHRGEPGIHADSRICVDGSMPTSPVEPNGSVPGGGTGAASVRSPPPGITTVVPTSKRAPPFVRTRQHSTIKDVVFANPFRAGARNSHHGVSERGSRRGKVISKCVHYFGRLVGIEISLECIHRSQVLREGFHPRSRDASVQTNQNAQGQTGRVRFSNPITSMSDEEPTTGRESTVEAEEPITTIGAASIFDSENESSVRGHLNFDREQSPRNLTRSSALALSEAEFSKEHLQTMRKRRQIASREAELRRICYCSANCPCCSARMEESSSVQVEPPSRGRSTVSTTEPPEPRSPTSTDRFSEYRSSTSSSSGNVSRRIENGIQGFGSQFPNSSSSGSWPSGSMNIIASTRSSTGSSRPSTAEPVPSLTTSVASFVDEPDEMISVSGIRFASSGDAVVTTMRSNSLQSVWGVNRRDRTSLSRLRLRTDEARRSGQRPRSLSITAEDDVTPTQERPS